MATWWPSVDLEYRGGAIGDALFQNTLDVQARDHVIHMNVYPDSDVASTYIERYGFVITGIEDVLLPGGGREIGFKITRDDQINETYQREGPFREYDLSREKDKLFSDVRSAKERGEVVTRFVGGQKNPSVRRVVFERVVQEEKRKAG